MSLGEGENAESAAAILVYGQFQAFNSDHNIFHRMGIIADLRMGNVGVDNYQLVSADGKQLIIDTELSLTAHNVEKLRIVMHMRRGVPVAAILSAAYIAQFQGVRQKCIGGQSEDIILIAHKFMLRF